MPDPASVPDASKAKLVERALAAWNARDVEALKEVTTTDAVYVNPPTAVEPGTRHGHDGLEMVVRKQWEGLGADARQHLDSIHPHGDGIVTVGRVSRTMPGSTALLENRVVMRWSFREDRIARLEVVGAGSTFQQALEAARVPPPGSQS